MPKWWIQITTEGRKVRDFTWDSKYGDVAEHDWLGCDHPTGSVARDLETAERIARDHAERSTGERVKQVDVWSPDGSFHHRERR
jgi:hypothetical protein